MRVSFILLLTIVLVLVSAFPDPERDDSRKSENTPDQESNTSSSSSNTSPTRTARSNASPSLKKLPKRQDRHTINDGHSPVDDFTLYGKGGLPASLVEDKWSKGCDDSAVKTFKEHPDRSWQALGCNEMFTAVNVEWWNNRNKTNLSYLEYAKPQPQIFACVHSMCFSC